MYNKIDSWDALTYALRIKNDDSFPVQKTLSLDNWEVKVYQDEDGNDRTVKVTCKSQHGGKDARATAVCDANDQFSLEQGVCICVGKLMTGNASLFNKIVNGLVKKYNKGIDEQKKEDEKAAVIERRKNKAIEKKRRRMKRREEEERERQIEIQKEAYKRAIRELEAETNAKELDVMFGIEDGK